MISSKHPGRLLTTAEAKEAQERVWQRLPSPGLLAGGYHFCIDCQHVTELIGLDKGGPGLCCFCGSYRVKFLEKLLA